MNDKQKLEIMRRQAEGMRAMSTEEMARRQVESAQGARNAYPQLTSWQLAQASQNWWAQCRGEDDAPLIETPPEKRPTLLERLKRWLRA